MTDIRCLAEALDAIGGTDDATATLSRILPAALNVGGRAGRRPGIEELENFLTAVNALRGDEDDEYVDVRLVAKAGYYAYEAAWQLTHALHNSGCPITHEESRGVLMALGGISRYSIGGICDSIAVLPGMTPERASSLLSLLRGETALEDFSWAS